jgi:hypothetical protein
MSTLEKNCRVAHRTISWIANAAPIKNGITRILFVPLCSSTPAHASAWVYTLKEKMR